MTAGEEEEDLAGATQQIENSEDATVPSSVNEDRVETQFFDIAAADEVSEIDCESPTASLDSEDYRQASSCLAGHVDFLGAATCSKLIPASSTFRRSKRNTLGAISGSPGSRQGKQPSQKRHQSLQASLLERHGGDHRVSVKHLHMGETSLRSCSSENVRSTSGSECDVTQQSAHDGRRRRSSVLRERGRERRRGSMKAVAERLGEVMKTRGLEVVPEEVDEQLVLAMRQDEHQKHDVEKHRSEQGRLADVDAVQLLHVTQEFEDELRGEKALVPSHPDKSDAAMAKKEEILKADSQQNEQRPQTDEVQKTGKRFTLPLRSSRRRRHSNGSLFSVCSTITDSEDSMSSAGLSESSGSSSQTLSSISCRYGQTSTTALDTLFEKARHTAMLRRQGSSDCHASSETAESSRASSPGALPSAELPATSRKPTPAFVSRSEDLTAVVQAGRHQLQARGESQLVSQQAGSASLQAARAFNFCFPSDLCGVPSDKKSGKPLEEKAGNKTHASKGPAVSLSCTRVSRHNKCALVDGMATGSETRNNQEQP